MPCLALLGNEMTLTLPPVSVTALQPILRAGPIKNGLMPQVQWRKYFVQCNRYRGYGRWSYIRRLGWGGEGPSKPVDVARPGILDNVVPGA